MFRISAIELKSNRGQLCQFNETEKELPMNPLNPTAVDPDQSTEKIHNTGT